MKPESGSSSCLCLALCVFTCPCQMRILKKIWSADQTPILIIAIIIIVLKVDDLRVKAVNMIESINDDDGYEQL